VRAICRIFVLLIGWLAISMNLLSAGEIAAPLDERLVSAGPDEFVALVVLMDEFPERDRLLAEVRGLNRAERRRHTVTRLKSVAARTQLPVHAAIDAAGSDVRDVRVLWGINGVALEAKPAVIERLAEVPGVRRLIYDGGGGGRPAVTDDADVRYLGAANPWTPGGSRQMGSGPTGGDVSGPNPEADVAPELIAMGAKEVWDELGYTGAGVIVAVIDTGVDRTHPDLADHIWTNLDEIADNGIDDDGNGYVDDTWGWDYCGNDNTPDTGNHGTQAAGQVAGDGTGGTVTGMAPDAELMILGIDCGTPDSIAWESSDYAIENGADIITMSFVWQWIFRPDQEAFRRQSDTELAAGVIRANAAGNDGGNPSTPVPYNVAAPANSPPPWTHPDQLLAGGVSSTLAIGNISWDTDTIVASSSHGPSAWEDIRANTDPDYPYSMPLEYQDYPYQNGAQMGLLKPDISAYGNGTTTTCPGPSYCSFSGTSSATPHVAGTLALMLEANPEATPVHLAQALLESAEHRGEAGKNIVYGVGLVQARPALELVASNLLYDSHAIDDTLGGNGNFILDPGEQVTMRITLRNGTDGTAVDGAEAILTSSTPGVEIHEALGQFPTVPAAGTAESLAPHFSFTVDAEMCATAIAFDLVLRFDGEVHRVAFGAGVGDPVQMTFIDDDFETDQGWTTDPGEATQGFWVRVDPDRVLDFSQRLTNPEDDTTPDPGTHCWVTGNGSALFNPNGNDVDNGLVALTSPPFGSAHLLTLDIRYDRWCYDPSQAADDSCRAELSNDGGANWTPIEVIDFAFGGWGTRSANLLALLPPTDDMRVRFTAEDGNPDGPVEAAIDEVMITGIVSICEDYVPPVAQAPNPVGDTLRVTTDAGGHVVLGWDAPPVDAGHDAATLYRVDRASSAQGPFDEVGSAITTQWFDVDGVDAPGPSYYRVRAENSGGTE
jgi:subtilisin family serine protease